MAKRQMEPAKMLTPWRLYQNGVQLDYMHIMALIVRMSGQQPLSNITDIIRMHLHISAILRIRAYIPQRAAYAIIPLLKITPTNHFPTDHPAVQSAGILRTVKLLCLKNPRKFSNKPPYNDATMI